MTWGTSDGRQKQPVCSVFELSPGQVSLNSRQSVQPYQVEHPCPIKRQLRHSAGELTTSCPGTRGHFHLYLTPGNGLATFKSTKTSQQWKAFPKYFIEGQGSPVLSTFQHRPMSRHCRRLWVDSPSTSAEALLCTAYVPVCRYEQAAPVSGSQGS